MGIGKVYFFISLRVNIIFFVNGLSTDPIVVAGILCINTSVLLFRFDEAEGSKKLLLFFGFSFRISLHSEFIVQFFYSY